jgi:hypothetical protein
MEVDPEKIVAWCSIVGTGLGAMWAVRAYGVRYIRRVIRIEKRVTTLWGFYMARGYVEAVTTGSARQNGGRSLSLSPGVRRLFEPVAAELKEFRGRHPGVARDDLMELIEEHFGPWLVDNICIPLGIYHGGCLQLAYEVAVETVPAVIDRGGPTE